MPRRDEKHPLTAVHPSYLMMKWMSHTTWWGSGANYKLPLHWEGLSGGQLSWAVTCCQPGSWHISAGNLTGKRREFTQCSHIYTLQWFATGTRFILNPIFSICTCTFTVHTWTNTNGTTDLHHYNHTHVKSAQLLPHNNHSPHIFSMHIHSSSPTYKFLYLNKWLTPLFPFTFTDLESELEKLINIDFNVVFATVFYLTSGCLSWIKHLGEHFADICFGRSGRYRGHCHMHWHDSFRNFDISHAAVEGEQRLLHNSLPKQFSRCHACSLCTLSFNFKETDEVLSRLFGSDNE